MTITSVRLRYLLTIYEASCNTSDVCSAAIARTLKVSKPSVARMLNAFTKEHLIVKKPYGKIYLTDKGVFFARQYQKNLQMLAEKIDALDLELSSEETQAVTEAIAGALPARYYAEKYD